jgi:hypothetical protein
MIVCSMIFVLCNCQFRDTWFLCLKTMKILFSRKKIRSWQTRRFVFCCLSSFDWRFNSFLLQIWCFFFCFFRMQNRFKKSHVVQFVLFINFYFALKRLNEMISFAINAFSFLDRRVANAFAVKTRTCCVTLIIFARFIYMFVSLTIESLL